MSPHLPPEPPAPAPAVPPPTVPPLPSAPPLPDSALAALLNDRFARGRPSNDLDTAGVLVHSFDDMDQHADPWNPCPPSQWCARYGDRFSACLVNRRVPHLFNAGVGGFVIAAAALQPLESAIACSWSYDAGTMGQGSGGCEGNGRCASLGSYYCWWRGTETQLMLEQQAANTHAQSEYNEIMLRAEHWTAHLPAVIAAVFHPAGRDEARSRRVHEALLLEYGLDARAVPRLELNMARLDAPFS